MIPFPVRPLLGSAALLSGLALVPAPSAAAAQAVSGTSSAGLFYEASGAGEPVVLIHGFSMDRRQWEPQIAALEGRFRVIRYDLRGHGRSEPPSAPYAATDDLRSVLDALGIPRATLVGLSAGAQVATDFALAHPERVARLVLAAPGLSGYVPPSPLTWVRPVVEAAAAGEPDRAARLWAGTPIMTLLNDQSAAAMLTGLVMSNSRIWTYRTNPERPFTPPAIGRLAEIRCPVLVLVGKRDQPHIGEVAGLLVRGIAGAKLVILPGAGHILNLDAGERFNAELATFLRGGLAGPAPRAHPVRLHGGTRDVVDRGFHHHDDPDHGEHPDRIPGPPYRQVCCARSGRRQRLVPEGPRR